jgi:hypothetical protein
MMRAPAILLILRAWRVRKERLHHRVETMRRSRSLDLNRLCCAMSRVPRTPRSFFHLNGR